MRFKHSWSLSRKILWALKQIKKFTDERDKSLNTVNIVEEKLENCLDNYYGEHPEDDLGISLHRININYFKDTAKMQNNTINVLKDYINDLKKKGD